MIAAIYVLALLGAACVIGTFLALVHHSLEYSWRDIVTAIRPRRQHVDL